MTELRYANTTAARMLTDGLHSAAQERGLSLREIGRRLGYKQPVVLSHMAKGRVPVPIDRAPEIARQVGMPPDQFLKAVIHQHHPEIEWGLITGFDRVAGETVTQLSAGHQRVLREVIKDQRPQERWLSVREVAAVELLRELFPNMTTSGLSVDDRDAIRLGAHLRRAEDAAESHQQPTRRSKKNES